MAARIGWKRRMLLAMSAAMVLVAITSVASIVSAAPAKKYSLAVSPATMTVGTPTQVVVTMTNVTPPGTNSNPSSFFVTVPFPISGAITLPPTVSDTLAGSSNPNLSATVEVSDSRISVKSLDAVNKGQFVKVTFTVTPASCTQSPYNWILDAQGNPTLVKVTNGGSLNGDPFAPTSTNVTTSVLCGPGPPASVTFTSQPTNTLVNDCINNPGCPATPTGAVTVEVKDVNGNHVADGTNVTMTIGVDPTGPPSPLGGTLTKTTSAGFASFPDLKISTTSSGYVLHAVSGAASGDSATFAITNTNTACGGQNEPACTATFPNGTSTVTAPAGTELIIETNQLQCSGVQNPIAGTVTINPPTGSAVIQVLFTDQTGFPIQAPFPGQVPARSGGYGAAVQHDR